MGRQTFKRPINVPTSTNYYGILGGLGSFQSLDFTGTSFVGTASSAATSIGWNKVTLLAAFSSAGAANPIVFSMAAATSGSVAYLSSLTQAASSNQIAVRLQAATSAKTFDGSNDQLLFSYPYQSALLVALSSSRVMVVGCNGSSGMITASSS